MNWIKGWWMNEAINWIKGLWMNESTELKVYELMNE